MRRRTRDDALKDLDELFATIHQGREAEKKREVLYMELVHAHGMSRGEIARRYGITEHAVSKVVQRSATRS